jgi:hypothetical protein
LYLWHAPKLLKRPKSASQSETIEEKKIGAHSLIRNILGVGGHARAPCWDYDKLTSESSRWNQATQPKKEGG